MASSSFALVLRQLRRKAPPGRGDESSDAKLLERIRKGQDHDAFETLVRRHGPLVWRVCRRVLGACDGAEDTFQATFLVLARRARSIRKPASLASWLHGVAVRVARNARSSTTERESAAVRAQKGIWAQGSPASSPLDPAHAAAAREIGRIVEEEVHALPERLRLPILLCYWEGKTNDEAARQLGWAAGTVKTRLAKAREMLHGRLLRRGVTLSIGAVSLLLAPETAKAILPSGLLASTIEVAKCGIADKLDASAQVLALADGVTKGTVLFKLVAMGLLLLGLGGAAMGLTGYATMPENPQARIEARPLELQEPEAPQKPAVDLYGDPLPPGVLKRFGTVRLRHAGGTLVGFAHDKTLLSVGGDRKLRFWDMETGTLSRTLPGPDPGGGIWTNRACSADGSTVAAWCNKRDSGVILWDAKTGKERLTIPLKCWGCLLTFAPDGRTLAVGEKVLHLYDPATGQEKIEPWKDADSRDITHVAFSPDGKKVAICLSPGWIVLLDAAMGNELRRFEDKDAGCVVFAPDGKVLVTNGGWQRGARLWDPENGTAKGELRPDVKPATRPEPAETSSWSHLAFSHDGKILATSSAGEPIILWDFAARKELRRLTTKDGRLAQGQLMFSPDNKTLAGSHWSAILLWDVDSGKELHAGEAHASLISVVGISPDGRLLASGSPWDRTVRLWDVATGRLLKVLENETFGPSHIAFSPDGRTLTAAGGTEGVIRQSNTTTGKQLREFQVRGPQTWVIALGLSSDGKALAAVSCDPNDRRTYALSAWKMETGKELVRRDLAPDSHGDFCFSPTAKTLARYFGPDSSREPGRLVLEDVVSGKITKLGLTGPGDLSFSQDGRLICSVKPKLTVWDVVENREVATLKAVNVYSAILSPDNRYAAAAGERSLRLWEVASAKEVLNLDSSVEKADTSFREICALAYAPDGRSLVSGMYDGNVLMWDLTPDRDSIRKAAGTSALSDLQRLWADLADKDASRAFIAAHALTSCPVPKFLAFLNEHLPPAKGFDSERLKTLLHDLDSEKFAERDGATKELEKSLEDIRPALERALKEKLTLETQRRIERLLARSLVLPPGDTLRQVRAVAILERIGTPEGRQFLERLATGNPDARLTHEATTALARMLAR